MSWHQRDFDKYLNRKVGGYMRGVVRLKERIGDSGDEYDMAFLRDFIASGEVMLGNIALQAYGVFNGEKEVGRSLEGLPVVLEKKPLKNEAFIRQRQLVEQAAGKLIDLKQHPDFIGETRFFEGVRVDTARELGRRLMEPDLDI